MDGESQGGAGAGGGPPATSEAAAYQQLQQQLEMFWSYQRQEMEQANDFRNHQLPLARIKKIMKAEEDVRMISAEASILFAKACELFILELTIRSWPHAEENKRRTLQKNDIVAAIFRTDIFDFLVDIVPREELVKEEGGGVPYSYPPIGPPGMMMGRPAVDQFAKAPFQAWQSVWQAASEDAGAFGPGHGGLDGQGVCGDVALVGSSPRQHRYSVSKSFKDDGFSWTKYGQKTIPGAKYPRSYYRCIFRNLEGCLATKQVRRSEEEMDVFEVTYRGEHTCIIARTTHPLLPHPSMPKIQEEMSNSSSSNISSSSNSSISFSGPATPQEIIECDDHLDTSQEPTAVVPSFNSLIQTTTSNRASSSSVNEHHHHHQYNKDFRGVFSPFKSPSTSAAGNFFFGDGHDSYGNSDSQLSNIINGKSA